MKSVHSGRLERWLGRERINQLSRQMRGWYGPPIHLLDVPGSVRVCGDGDFIGPFDRGYFMSGLDALRDHATRLARSRVTYGQLGAGFASVSDYLDQVARGNQQKLSFLKTGPGGAAAATWSLWSATGMPTAGAAASAAPGGRIPTNTTTGTLGLANPSSGTMHLTGADGVASLGSGSGSNLLLYDRLFDVAKTMNSTATEAVTGVPTRYQSTVVTAQDYAGGNFLFTEATTILSAGAHNWTVCTYTDQDGNTGITLPSFAGLTSCPVLRTDMPASNWFAPLGTGDTGIKALTQMQCSALIATGAINFVIGRPIGFFNVLLPGYSMPFDWITSKSLAPRVFDNAALALLMPTQAFNNATDFAGTIEITGAA